MENLNTDKIQKIANDEEFKIMKYRGQDTVYIISNYGRVFNRNTYKLKSKIIKPSGALSTVFRFNGKNVSCLTSKLVINNFVEKIDFDDKYLRVVYLDGDKNNIKYNNIFTSNVSDKIVYSEKKIREICELLQEGTKSIKTISLITKVPYYMIYNLFIKASRRNITKDYTFNCFTPEDVIVKDDEGNLKNLPSDMLTAKDEKFKLLNIKGYNTIYIISNYGRIINTKRKKELTPYWNEKFKSWFVTIYYNCKKSWFSLPKLVISHFNEEIDILDKKIEIGYKDGDRNNLKYDNLEILEFIPQYSIRQIKQVCKLLKQGVKYKEIEEKTSVSINAIKSIRSKRTWSKISKEYNL